MYLFLLIWLDLPWWCFPSDSYDSLDKEKGLSLYQPGQGWLVRKSSTEEDINPLNFWPWKWDAMEISLPLFRFGSDLSIKTASWYAFGLVPWLGTWEGQKWIACIYGLLCWWSKQDKWEGTLSLLLKYHSVLNSILLAYQGWFVKDMQKSWDIPHFS